MSTSAKIGIVMGSDSDLAIMQEAIEVCEQFGIEYEVTIVSAHRTPERLMAYGQQAQARGLSVIIAGAGGAAHLPGMLASLTPVPVVGVPILSRNSIDGWDSILSILQMPAGVPVATVALNGASNAGLLAARIVGCFDASVQAQLQAHQRQMQQSVLDKAAKLSERFACEFKEE